MARQDGKGRKDARYRHAIIIGMPSRHHRHRHAIGIIIGNCHRHRHHRHHRHRHYRHAIGIIGIGIIGIIGIGKASASARHRHRQDAGRQETAQWRSIVIQILKEG